MNWFENWFNSPYYHILYKNRDEREANEFIYRLIGYLNLKIGSKILDLACGKGRYSKFLSKLGFQVTGIDLSQHNIEIAKQFENQNLKFIIGDMRKVYFLNQFDVVFNLFTSFGYFNSDEENLSVFDAIAKQLKINGIFIFDYLNSRFVHNHLIKNEIKVIEGIEFKISKKILNNIVIKTIKFNYQNESFNFKEYVRLFNFNQLKKELQKRNLLLKKTFGSYELEKFDLETSKRMIMLIKKEK